MANFLPGHPWRKKPSARQALHHIELNDRHPWLVNASVRGGGLTDRQIDLALGEYAAREWMRPELGEARGAGWHAWLDQVLTTRVEILPAGRAVLRDPQAGIEAVFGLEPTGKRQKREPFLALSSVEIRSPGHPPNLVPENVDMTTLFAAFRIELERIEASSPRKRKTFYSVADRPEPGKPPKVDWYLGLLAEQEALKAQGHPAPDRELAERYVVKRSTLRGHLRKARELRAKREQESRR